MVQDFLQLSLEMEKIFTETSGTVHSVVDHPSCLTMDFRGMSAPALEASPPSSLVLVSAELLLSHILTVSFCCYCAGYFPHLHSLSQGHYHHH